MMTGASEDIAALVMLYVQKDMRNRGVGKSLLIAASDLLRQRGVTSALSQGFTANVPQAGMLRSGCQPPAHHQRAAAY